MKTIFLFAVLFTLVIPVSGQDINKLYEDGRALFNAGQFELAREKLAIVAARNPNHVPTRAMLAQIQQKLGSQNTTLRDAYAKIIIEKIELENVELNEAIVAVRFHTRKATNDKVTPNIIVKGEEIGKRPVSLSLTNVPLSEVLNYMAQLTDSQVNYDKSAILFTEKVPNKAAASAQTSPR